MKRKIIIIGIIMACCLNLFGCITPSDLIRLEMITDKGLKYMEDKYGESFEVKESEYISYGSPSFKDGSEDVEIVLTNGVSVMYFVDEKEYRDNYQTPLINSALDRDIWKTMLEKLVPYELENAEKTKARFNLCTVEGYEDSYFHEYYDGDIESFAEKEDLSIDVGYFDEEGDWNSSELCLISEDEYAWQDRMNIITETVEKYCGAKNEHGFSVSAVTTELYERITKDSEIIFTDIGMEGCWASGMACRYAVQKYIKVSDGIYISSGEPGFEFEEGDITLKEAMSPEELSKLMNEDADEESETCEYYEKYTMNSITPIYEFEFSDKVIKAFGEGEDRNMNIYVKYLPEEIENNSEYELFVYEYKDGEYSSGSYECDDNDSPDGDSMYIFVNDPDCKEYYWIGTQTYELIEASETVSE